MPWRGIYLQYQNIHLAEGPQIRWQLTMWYSNVLFELFQIEITLFQQKWQICKSLWENTKLLNKFAKFFLLPHESFLNLLINMFSLSGVLIV
jgi:hypothetical protein